MAKKCTVLWYYHRKTMEMLLRLNIVQYVDPPNGISFTCELTPEFVKLVEKLHKENDNVKYINSQNKQIYWDDLFKDVAKQHHVKLRKRLLYSMISLMLFIDKFGGKGDIWINKYGIHGSIRPQNPIHIPYEE